MHGTEMSTLQHVQTMQSLEYTYSHVFNELRKNWIQ